MFVAATQPLLGAVRDALRELAPAGVEVDARLVDPADLARLDPRELDVVRRAVASRQAQFASGRVLLHELTAVRTPILPRAGRAPALPDGRSCSLAHDHEVAVAAVACDAAVTAVGIDVEPIPTDTASWAAVVLRPDEAALDAGLAFVVKEAAYKAWTGLGGGMLAHHDVRVRIDGADATATILPHGLVLEGRWASVAGRYLALIRAVRTIVDPAAS